MAAALPLDVRPDELVEKIPPKVRSICQLDPGWALAHSVRGGTSDPLAVIAETPWWPVVPAGAPAEFVGRLWRYSVAVSNTARTLAREAEDRDPEGVARAGLLCRLGAWAVAAVDPEWLCGWWREPSKGRRREREVAELGTDLDDLGRRLAERWGCEPLVIDAAWLTGVQGTALEGIAAEPARLRFILEACQWADRTPWALGPDEPHDGVPSEPRSRILVAEVQARTASAFIAGDATPYEERMTRQNARLRLLLGQARDERDRDERVIQALASSESTVSPEDWAAQAAMVWCTEPGVSAARVVWAGEMDRAKSSAASVPSDLPENPNIAGSPRENPRPPALVLPLRARGQTHAIVQLWTDHAEAVANLPHAGSRVHLAWQTWCAMVADRASHEERLQRTVAIARDRIDGEGDRLHESKMAALAEFAGGSGHELNNPLAVIVGRAQLLLARTDDPETARSLRIILSQAARAHRILRDLMFVARPQPARPRSCRPAEIVRASVRDFQEECTARGIRLLSEIADSPPTAVFDPDGLRHLAEILLRNAVQATPSGGKIVVRTSVQGDELTWSFHDSGKGIAPQEAEHLFDPFFCGRQAGRGLGLGLPRAARIVSQAGGRMRWTTTPGHGAIFHVHLPIARLAQAPVLPAKPSA